MRNRLPQPAARTIPAGTGVCTCPNRNQRKFVNHPSIMSFYKIPQNYAPGFVPQRYTFINDAAAATLTARLTDTRTAESVAELVLRDLWMPEIDVSAFLRRMAAALPFETGATGLYAPTTRTMTLSLAIGSDKAPDRIFLPATRKPAPANRSLRCRRYGSSAPKRRTRYRYTAARNARPSSRRPATASRRSARTASRPRASPSSGSRRRSSPTRRRSTCT